MSQTVEIPYVGEVAFPDSASYDEICRASGALYLANRPAPIADRAWFAVGISLGLVMGIACAIFEVAEFIVASVARPFRRAFGRKENA